MNDWRNVFLGFPDLKLPNLLDLCRALALQPEQLLLQLRHSLVVQVCGAKTLLQLRLEKLG
jgi:hypothetical protein